MTPRVRRIIIPAVIVLVALSVVAIMFFADPPRPESLEEETAAEVGAEVVAQEPTGEADGAGVATGEQVDAGAGEEEADDSAASGESAIAAVSLEGLRAVAPETGVAGHDTPPASLGSLDPGEARMLVEFSRAGGGIARITFSDIWETAAANVRAKAFYAALAKGDPPDVTPPPDELRYVLQATQMLLNDWHPRGVVVPSLAANVINIDGGGPINVFDYNEVDGEPQFIWSEVAEGTFTTEIINAEAEPVLRITRRYTLGADYEIQLQQTLENLTGQPLDIRWYQYGPSSLRPDRSRYMDRRRYRFGYLIPQQTRDHVWADDSDLLLERGDILKRWDKLEAGEAEIQDRLLLWPNEASREHGYVLSWFGTTNRYFSLTVHPLPESTGLSLAANVERILFEVSAPPAAKDEEKVIFTTLASPPRTIAPGASERIDIGVYAGPLDRHILGKQEPYVALSMDQLILYQMSSCCAACTFQWLAHGLLAFLSFVHGIFHDWGLAIILLVVLVRILLHPITKKSQISMQRFGRAMSAIKPEMDKLQKKFPNEPKRIQQEQIRLMREHGVNPLQAVGCLPMFLQTPIWIALYAMLYFVFDLRHEPAFWGIFQTISAGHWSFLADLSAADHFFWEFTEPKGPWGFIPPITGINALPFLMGVIFFIQQKYMAPPPSPSMTKEQIQQQKIMKVLMIVLFPVMLYSAPSGLTLYILTSSCIGILESRYIRRHLSDLDLEKPKQKAAKQKKKRKPRDAQGRAYAAAIERKQEQQRRRQRGPEKRYKRRK